MASATSDSSTTGSQRATASGHIRSTRFAAPDSRECEPQTYAGDSPNRKHVTPRGDESVPLNRTETPPLDADSHVIWGRIEASSSSSNCSSPSSSLPPAEQIDNEDTSDRQASKFECIDLAGASGVLLLSSSSESEAQHHQTLEVTAGCYQSSHSSPELEKQVATEELAIPEASATAVLVHQEGAAGSAASSSECVPKRHPKLAAKLARSGYHVADSGQRSKGSALHASGQCKPCAWSWRPGGCSKGYNCIFCHSCDAEAHYQYKKENVAGLKRNRQKKERRRALRRGDSDEPHAGEGASLRNSSSGFANDAG